MKCNIKTALLWSSHSAVGYIWNSKEVNGRFFIKSREEKKKIKIPYLYNPKLNCTHENEIIYKTNVNRKYLYTAYTDEFKITKLITIFRFIFTFA